jgi:hydroxymethylpyrimidine/phosphomethylpyrimidine kinase
MGSSALFAARLPFMQQSILVLSSLFSGSGTGMSRACRMIVEMGHAPHPVISAINIAAADVPRNDHDLFNIPSEIVLAQVERTLENFPVRAIKIGFLGAAGTQTKLSERLVRLKKEQNVSIVLNPSLFTDTGATQSSLEEINALKRDLFLLADIATPSVAEAEKLTGMTIRDVKDMQNAADMLLTLGPRAVLIRGGEFLEDSAVDLLATDTAQLTFNTPRLLRNSYSGYGGVVACAIAVGLAKGQNFEVCVENALMQIKKMYLSDL